MRKRDRVSRPFVGVRAGSPASEPTPASPAAAEGPPRGAGGAGAAGVGGARL